MAESKSTANFWSGRRVLVTGATGFLGSRLCRQLTEVEHAHVFALVRDQDVASDLPYHMLDGTINGDIRDYFTLERAIAQVEPQAVFHLAAMSQVTECKMLPLQAYQTNILGTANLLEGLRKLRGSGLNVEAVVCASSDKAYGFLSRGHVATEYTPLDPIHPYDISKASGDFIARSYGQFYDLPVGVTRCGNIYGPGDTNWKRLIPGAIRSWLLREPFFLRSDGKGIREYNYVLDIVHGYIRLAEALVSGAATAGSVWNLSDIAGRCNSIHVLDALRTIGADIEVERVGETKDEGDCIALDARAAYDVLGWKPTIALEDGLLRTVEWIADYLGVSD